MEIGTDEKDTYVMQRGSSKDIACEFRKILDKIAIRIIIDDFENEAVSQAILNLSRSERIIIVFNIVLGMNLSEVAFLLGSSINSTKVQKSTAIKRLKSTIEEMNML